MTAGLAYEHNRERVSRERFYEIACDPRRSVAVEACAGAGKTWMLVSRILRALLDGAQPHEILAITFTKKAAGEMRERLLHWLAEFALLPDERLAQELAMRGIAHPTREDIERLRGLHAATLAAGRPVQVRTFHSWFAALLRNAPWAVLDQLGLPSRYELLENDRDAVALVWRRFHTVVARDPAARADFEASVRAHGRFNTQKALHAALDKRVEFTLADAGDVVDTSVKHFAEQFPAFEGLDDPCNVLAHRTDIRDLLIAAAKALGTGAPSFAAKGSELEQAVTSDDLQGAFDALLTKTGEPRKFSEKIVGLAQVRAAQEAVAELVELCAQHSAWQHHGRIARLARILIAEFAALKREHGWIDMNDVERAALVLLSDGVLAGWVQERLDARTRHLLIDEFQDTNPLQWQALGAWLQGYAGAGTRAPSVFLVGDPKQSIYRFRRAEPQVFIAAQAFVVEGLGGDLLSCDHTHRNAPEVIAAVNQVMSEAQAAGEYSGFRAHTTQSTATGAVKALPQIPRAPRATKADPPPELTWRDSLTVPRELPEEKLLQLECRQAAAWVAAQVAAGTPCADIMVLARRRDRLSAMEAELRLLHIPAQQPEKSDLCEAPEVQDIVALMDALVSPSHDLSLAIALKSPLFGLTDEMLAALALQAREAREKEQFSTWFDLLQLQREATGPLGDAARSLAGWKQLVKRLPPHDVLDAIYAQGDVLARFAAAAPEPLRELVVTRLKALLSAALQVDGGRYATPYAFVRALKAGGIEAPATSRVDAVRLLTVHGAKGLEAGTVLMLDTDASAPRADTMGVIVEWPGEEAAPVRFAFLASESRPPACSVAALEAERIARQREELNGLYVAMTRARHQLVVSSIAPHAANPASWWQRLQPVSEPLEAAGPPAAATTPVAHQFAMPELPELSASSRPAAGESLKSTESENARFGQALHRLLEWWRPGAEGFTPSQLRRVGREFGLGSDKVEQAAQAARQVLKGEGAWTWDSQVVDWQGNEVPMQHEGAALRLDRLVRRGDTGAWWVLDYKSAFRPQDQDELLAQLRQYRSAVSAAYPGAKVMAAFLTGNGKLVQVD